MAHPTTARKALDVDTTPTKNNPVGFRDITEVYCGFPCEVTGGKIPEFLQGHYFKQSGAAFDSGVETAQLDGLAGITSFKIDGENNKVLYSSTILKQQDSRDYLESHGRLRNWVGTASAGGSSTSSATIGDKFRGWAHKLSDFFTGGDPTLYRSINPNVVVWKLTDPSDHSLVYPAAMTEAEGTVLRFDKDTLESVGPVSTIKPETPKTMVITTPAHYFEPIASANARGGPYHVALEMAQEGFFPPTFHFSYAIYSGSVAPFRRVTAKPLASFSYMDRAKQPLDKRPGYMHCYAQTTNYLVLFASRQRLNYSKLLGRDFSNGFFGLFDPEDVPLEFIVFKINREDVSKDELEYVGTYSNPELKRHVWHMSNSFEDDEGRIVIDASGTNKLGKEAESYMTRYVVDLTAKSVKAMKLGGDAYALEFPQINPLANFSEYRYSYALSVPSDGLNTCLAKVDVTTGEVVATAYPGKRHLLGEPVFVPRNRTYGRLTKEEEEDGVILQAVTDAAAGPEGASWLAILDPKDLSEICRVVSPQIINAGLHCHFFPKEALICKI